MEEIVVSAVAHVKMAETAAASTITRRSSTQAITIIWKGTSKEYHKTVIAACRKKGRNYIQTARKKDVSDTKGQLYGLSSTLTEMKASIYAFSRKPQGTSSSESNSIPIEDVPPKHKGLN